jgi:general secretion pathway protein D
MEASRHWSANLTRRIVLKTLIPCIRCIALIAASGAAWVQAAPRDAIHLSLAVQAAAQTGKAKPSAEERREVESLLTRARSAMKEGNFEAADAMISRAEAVPVEYGMFHMGDTPKKCRHDWESRRHSAKKNPALPSQKAKPNDDKEQTQPPEGIKPDPFKARSAQPRETIKASEGIQPAEQATEIELPNLGRKDATIEKSPFTRSATIVPPSDEEVNASLPAAAAVGLKTPTSDARQKSDAMLLAARKALAVGDVRVAKAKYEEAKALGVEYGYHDDTPARVDATIRKYEDTMAAPANLRATDGWRRQYADLLMEQSSQLLRWKNFDEAERLANDAGQLKVNYGPFEAKPATLLDRIAAERKPGGAPSTAKAEKSPKFPESSENVVVAVAKSPAETPAQPAYPVTNAAFDAATDTTQNTPASAQLVQPTKAKPAIKRAAAQAEVDRLPPAAGRAEVVESTTAQQLVTEGEQALRDRDIDRAVDLFRQANTRRDELDPKTAQHLQDHLQMLAAPSTRQPAAPRPLIDDATAQQQLLLKQLSAEITRQQMAARQLTESDPRKAMEILKQARTAVEEATVDPEARETLFRRLDTSIAEVDKYVEQNRNQLELDARNKEILDDVQRRRHVKVEVDEKLAKYVNEFNTLMDEQRFAEAEIVAKRAVELAPDKPLARQLEWVAKFARRTNNNSANQDDQEEGAIDAWASVDESAVPWDDRVSMTFPDARSWKELTKTRTQRLAESRSRRSEKELQIERKLKTPVSANFNERPLAEVLEQLGKLANVNIYLDPQGLTEEGVASDTPVTINLQDDISLKSALNLILEPLHLSYVIKDEVLKITSEQMRDGEVYTVTYSVADLVIPIPNFVPNSRMGLSAALADSYGNLGMGAYGGFSSSAPSAVLASNDGKDASGVINPAVLAQMQQAGGTRPASGMPQSLGSGMGGPGGMGGGVQADFDSLIDLITNTVQPTTWDEVGGPGTVSQFETNLSLVISQTQEVHDQIRDLLEQLRRLKDLQVTIEVRFITLNDNFFERIGVDFDFDIQTHIPEANATRIANGEPANPSATVGRNVPNTGPFPDFTGDLDIPFRQNSFDLAVPQFGQPVDVAQFGFAILSDIEAYFLITAAQGDRRSNVLQAPKVTLFNGQQASVSDTTQTPFVISVIPVVGDFAAAQQPVIVVLNEGTFLTVQAVVSNDHRFVRLTVVPFFSKIGDVDTFQFTGSTTTTKNTSQSQEGEDNTSETDDETVTNEGVTVQLPSFSFVSVTTTVSVPDGGTVLLGGIKRLSEGRNEFGVPILSKLPYVSRLFKNVGIGRETQSLMMMVTPRIIIQEEEEERLGISPQEP